MLRNHLIQGKNFNYNMQMRSRLHLINASATHLGHPNTRRCLLSFKFYFPFTRWRCEDEKAETENKRLHLINASATQLPNTLTNRILGDVFVSQVNLGVANVLTQVN